MKRILMRGGLHRAFRLLLVASLGAVLSACGGGGGGVSSLTPTPAYTVTGSVVAGVVRGAEVSVYQVVDGQQGAKIESGTTQADGTYTIAVGSYSGPVLVVTTGGVYTDESTGLEIDLSTAGPGGTPLSLRAVHPGQAANVSVVVTPLTELATRKALAAATGLTADNINAANTLIAKEFLGDEAFDITATVPADVTDVSSASAAKPQQEYGLMLAAFSQAENNSGSTLGVLLDTYATDLADDTFDNANKLVLNQALLEFINGPRNESGIGEDDTDLDDDIAPTNTPPTASNVTISDTNAGDVVVGDSLVGNYSYADPENDDEGSTTFRWLRNGAPIGAATARTYVVTAEDSGASLVFEVTPIAAAGLNTNDKFPSDPVSVVNSAPVVSGVRIVDANAGLIIAGDVLTGEYSFSDIDNDLEGDSVFRWFRGTTLIPGENSPTYEVTPADSGFSIGFEVTPVAATGVNLGAAVTAAGVVVANLAPVANSVMIEDENAGVVVVGDVLTGSYEYADHEGNPEGASTFRWLSDGVGVGTALAYTVAATDSGATLIFEVTPIATVGASPGMVGVSSGVNVNNSVPVATGVGITDTNDGDVVVGDILVGGYSYSDIDNDLEGKSTFRWLRDGVAIAAAVDSTYTVVAEDSGSTLVFEVTPVASTGASPGLAQQASSGFTVANSAPVVSDVSIEDVNGGSLIVGDTLTGSYVYTDLDNDAEAVSTFRWLRDGVVIANATATDYVLVADDSGTTLTLEVTPVAASGIETGTAVVSAGVTAVNSAPEATGVDIVDDNGGDAVVGDTLTGNYAYFDLDDDTEGTSTFRWLRDGLEVSTAATYTVVADDSGATLIFEVTPVAVEGVSPGVVVLSPGLPVVNSAPVANGVNIIDDNGGKALAGETLTASYLYSDVDGDLEGGSTFRWLRNGEAIAGATGLTYILVVADADAEIKFEVTPVAQTGVLGGSPVVSSGLGVNNNAPVASAISITDDNGGDTVVGDTLTGNYDYNDVESDPEGSSTFRWLRNGAPINAAVATTYTVVAADTGAALTFEVTPVAATGAGAGTIVTSDPVTVANSAPVASGVGITDVNGGSAVVGDSLMGEYSFTDVDGDTQGTSTFRWLREGTAITGATSVNYSVSAADVGKPLTFEVTPVASNGVLIGENVVSSAINIVNSAPTASGVSIVDSNGGDPVVGDFLSGGYVYEDVDLDLEGVSSYRWLRNGVAIASTRDYTVVAADSGKTLAFEVTPVAATGEITGVAVASDGITVINSAPLARNVAISDDNGGEAVVGDVLTGQYDYDDLDNDAQATSTYRWLRDGVVISGATALTHTVVAADSGATLTFEVTPMAETGITTGIAVVSTGITTVNSAPVAGDVVIVEAAAGDAFVGAVLTGSYTYDDLDNDVEAGSTFRWLRGGVAIAGATALTYTPVVDDLGSAIVFEVTPGAATGLAAGAPVVSAGITVVNSVPGANEVVIVDDNGGGAVVGDNLTGNYTYVDADTDAEGATSFRWLRNGAPISGATASVYTVVVGDVGADISFEVTPLASTGVSPGEAVVSGAINIANSAPVASGVAIVDDNGGNALVGDSLTGTYSYADVDTDAEGETSFRWFRDGTEITGATASTYVVVIADAGAIITFEVTPVASTGTLVGNPVTSAGLALFNSAPTATAVGISEINVGATVVGDTLMGNYTYGDLDNDAEGVSTFRWLRDGAVISGATLSTYVVVAADSGKTLTFEVTPIAATGVTDGVAVVSAAGVTVVNSAPTATDVSITDVNGGSTVVGDELTATYTYSDGDLDAEGVSTFRWLRNGSEISGATLTTYTVVPADSNTTLTFEVTPIAVAGVVTGSTVVSAVGVDVLNSVPVASAVTITGDTAGNVVVGDVLTASYTYSDVDEDLEGISTYRWLNGGSPIPGATSLTYTVSATDNIVTLTFEVTPVAETGGVDALIGQPVVTSDGITVLNSVPVATDVVISGDSGGGASVGSVLTGTYTYSDVDLDLEGTSTFRWLRDGAPIADETGINYTTVVGDVDATITFEVTPYAATGAGALVGAPVVSAGIMVYTSPTVTGVARFFDTNVNGAIDSGDRLVIPFDQSVTVNIAGAGDFSLPVGGDSLGSGAVIAAGPASNEVTITLGSAPQLVTRDTFAAGTLAAGSPSGIDIAATITADAIESSLTGIDAAASTPIDIIPTFSDSGQSLGNSDSRAIAVGDIDGDGDLDIVAGNEAGQANKIYLNNGAGVFSDSGQSLGSSNTFGIALGDLDGDLDLDLVIGNHAQANRIFTNNSGVFTDTGQLIGLYGTDVDGVDLYGDTRAVALGDVDGDGDLDFVAANESTTTHPNHVFMNNGSASFVDGVALTNLRASRAVVIADITGDGDLDFVIGNYNAWHDLYTGDGSGDFSSSSVVQKSYPTRSVALGDVDGDGDLDEVVGNVGKINRVFINNGLGGFTNKTQVWTNENGTNGVVLLDVDGDGDLDMVAANYGQANLVYLNDGSGVFVDSGQVLGSNNSTAVAVGDFNDDGLDDLVIANDGQPNRVYFASP